MLAGIVASALLAGLYARGGPAWPLGFVALAPWLCALDASRSVRHALLAAWAMSIAYSAAVFAWFGIAIGGYTQLGSATGLALLLVAAPLFQPQFLAHALVRRLASSRYGRGVGALAGAAAWVATEALVPRLLGDTFGHGLHPSLWMRQAADLGGAAGLTVVLLLTNEALAAAWARRAVGAPAVAPALAIAAVLPLLLAAYGVAALLALPSPTGKPVRVGLVQANLVDYEGLRREHGAGAVVRAVLDLHFAMSHDAVERQHVEAVLWSETVYPTTFGHPKSAAGAEFDAEILAVVDAAKVPFVFGTYDRDADGEYNAAAFVAPGTGLLGFYRKTRVFPLTEYVPAWLDGPWLRRWLPWAGTWQPGSGARIYPLRLADGREVPVLPLICLDDVDTGLAVDGARLGAQVILTLSNDAWFSGSAQGAELHAGVAAFRSVETRLPQLRVTTNGASAVIDAAGSVVAGARIGERSLVVGDVPVRDPPRTLVVAWGDWVGHAGAGFVLLLAGIAALQAWPAWRSGSAPASRRAATAWPVEVAVLEPAARVVAGLLRVGAGAGLLWMTVALLWGDGALQVNTLARIRSFVAFVLVPQAAAWCVLRAYAARASLEPGRLLLRGRGGRRLELPLRDIAAIEPWRLPLPGAGLTLRLQGGGRWRYGLALADPAALARAFSAAGVSVPRVAATSAASVHAQARHEARHGRLNSAWVKFGLYPLVLAIPAFRLHQHIAYGSGFGEYTSHGLLAYGVSFGIWWAAWAIGVVLCAAGLRAVVEIGAVGVALLHPAAAVETRWWLERLALVALYLGLPAVLLLRAVAG
ncbi:MAG: apolipoprotein N-acyltransferase [Burkholderiaceae bacterium]